jgi:hypothetical protein
MTIPHVDVKAQYAPLLDELKERLAAVLDSGRFILGPEVRAFEEEAAAYLGTAEAVGVANGTDALVLVLEALGVGAGDEVVCPAFTFYATAEAISRVGATPVFCDIDPVTLNLDPADVAVRVGERTKAILAVHLFGRPASLAELPAGLPVIEDAAQAFGASSGGRRVGAIGAAGTFSFFRRRTSSASATGARLHERSASPSGSGSCGSHLATRGASGDQDELATRQLQAAALRLFLRPPRRVECGPALGGRALRGARPRRPLRAARGRARARLPHVRRALVPARPHRRGAARGGHRLRDLLHDAAPPATGLRRSRPQTR